MYHAKSFSLYKWGKLDAENHTDSLYISNTTTEPIVLYL